MGHEFSGVLSEVGKNVKQWKVGDRVVINPMGRCGECYACKSGIYSACPQAIPTGIGIAAGVQYAGAFAKFAKVHHPEHQLYRLPDELTFEEGALIEPLSCGLHAVRISKFKGGDKVLVLGCGMMGLAAITALKISGASLIMASEVIERKGEIARKLGADYVFNPKEVVLKDKVFELTDGLGVDVVFDCTGLSVPFKSAPDFLKPRGQVLMVGIITGDTPFVPLNFTVGEKSLQATLVYVDEYPMVIDLLTRKERPPVSEIITGRIKLSEIVTKGFDELLKPNAEHTKIIVQPDI
jgi:(R,R)-butanediol dehydrogenase/meso-butanediol dehydrogenase/diacetyl reductase